MSQPVSSAPPSAGASFDSALDRASECEGDARAPLGVFDSGLGGLTVVRRLRETLPNERLVYVADQSHVPYGGRELHQVRGFACAISAGLLALGCKALVMACNISSATALDDARTAHPAVPIAGVILPGAQAAAAQTRSGRVGVLTTEGTLRTGAYTRALHALNPGLHVREVACPAFVPLVEAGLTDTPEAREAARAYLTPLLAERVDTIILGCTHYPFLLDALRANAPGVTFVDPAEQTVRALAETLSAGGRLAPVPRAPARHLLTTTGDPQIFAVQTCHFLPDARETADIGQATWHSSGLLTIGPRPDPTEQESKLR